MRRTRGQRKWVFAALVAAAAAASTFAAFAATTEASDSAKAPIVIGYAYDAIGRMSPIDGPPLTAAQLEVKKLNAKGGVLGRKLEIKTCDTQDSKPEVSRACAAKLIGQGAKIMFVTCDVDFSTPAIQESINKGLLTIAPCIGTDQMGPKRFGTKGKLAFSIGNVAQDEGAAMAEYAYNVKKWRTAVTVTDNLILFFSDIVKSFTVRFKELGGKIVSAESFTNGDKTIQNVISRVNQQKADVVATCTSFGDWPAFMAGFRSLGNKTPILSCWAPDGTYWYPKKPKVTNFWYTTYASVFGDDPNGDVRTLIGQMKAIGKAPATGGFVTGAAAIQAVVAAIKQANGSTDGKTLAALFEKFRGLATISGKISYSTKFHSVFGRPYRIIEVQNNKPKYVASITATSPANIG